MANNPTNETMLKDLIKDLNGIELALLRERIVLIMALTKENIEKNPSDWENGLIDSSLYLMLCKKVDKYIGFNDN